MDTNVISLDRFLITEFIKDNTEFNSFYSIEDLITMIVHTMKIPSNLCIEH